MIVNVPNYAMELLQKRKDLATMLISVSKELDEYCCRIGLSVDSRLISRMIQQDLLLLGSFQKMSRIEFRL